MSKLQEIFCTLTGHGFFLFRQQCNMLCTSGFVDNVKVTHKGQHRGQSLISMMPRCRRHHRNHHHHAVIV